jgi:two-component system chemotaxis response regulator CheV
MTNENPAALSLAEGGTPGGILLDAGTNELEVLVFRMGTQRYGVNVAKVREVIRGETPSEPPKMHRSIVGVINKRGQLIPLVDLGKHLGLDPIDLSGIADARIIVTEFNGMVVGFLVEAVERIHRLGWDRVQTVPDLGEREAGVNYSTCTGIIRFEEYLLLMIDFESITDSIRMEDKLHVTSVDNPLGVDRGSVRVVMAEDSSFMRDAIGTVFRQSGYTNATIFADGQAAWDAISAGAAQGEIPDIVISDIEMPRMDGLRLTKEIKGDARLAGVPVVLFSSLITEENRKKGEQVGADRQLSKPELPDLVRLVDEFVHGMSPGVKSAA